MSIGTSIAKVRSNAVFAHVGPLLVFLLLMQLVPVFKKSVIGAPWYQAMPEHWVYPLQTLICGALIVFWWRHYDWGVVNWKTLTIGALAGVIGIAIWLLPTEIYYRSGGDVAEWMKWFGVRERAYGFDPYFVEWPGVAIALRLIRMAIVVAFVEELLWRGFLMRFLVDIDGNFKKIPFGTHRWRVFWIVTLLVMFIHTPADYAVAFIWGSIVYALAVWTRSLAACVMMHGVANLILGIYVLKTGHQGLW